MKKMLIVYDYYFPAFKAGGISQSLFNLVNLIDVYFDIYIIALDKDLNDKSTLSGITPETWTVFSKNVTIYYSSLNVKKLGFWKGIIKSINPDLVYINGIFSFHFNIKPLLLIKYFSAFQGELVIAPRGMLQKGALRSKKLKKHIFLRVSKAIGLYNNLTWHATDEQEASDIKHFFIKIRSIYIIPNIPKKIHKPITILKKNKLSGQVDLTSISLITPKKNIDFSINILSKIKNNYQINFVVFGPIKEVSYWNDCKKLIHNENINVNISYGGVLSPDMILPKLFDFHFFLLPTQGENFGHAIFEAMSAGLPVIISDQTPWRNLEVQKVGWDIPLSEPERFVAAIERAARMDQTEYDQWSRAAHQYALDFIAKSNLKERYLEMFSTT